MEIRPPKYSSERTVYTPDRLVALLAEHVRLYRPGDDSDRWLFPGSRNAELPANAATVARSWRIVRDQVGIEAPVARPSALLCQRAHQGRMRRGDRSSGLRALLGDNHPHHVLAPVAGRQ